MFGSEDSWQMMFSTSLHILGEERVQQLIYDYIINPLPIVITHVWHKN